MKPLITLIFILWFGIAGQTQTDQHYYSIAISNSHAAKPFSNFSSLIYKDFHPGLDVAYGLFSSKGNHQWLAEASLSYFFHRWVQHTLALSINGGYRHTVAGSWGVETKIGAGYMAAFSTGKVFSVTDNGLKPHGNGFRSQFTSSLGFGVDKKINARGNCVFVQYTQRLQMPFVKQYVPVLPYNTLSAGIRVPVH